MKKATYADRQKVIDILCQAFIDVLIPNYMKEFLLTFKNFDKC